MRKPNTKGYFSGMWDQSNGRYTSLRTSFPSAFTTPQSKRSSGMTHFYLRLTRKPRHLSTFHRIARDSQSACTVLFSSIVTNLFSPSYEVRPYTLFPEYLLDLLFQIRIQQPLPVVSPWCAALHMLLPGLREVFFKMLIMIQQCSAKSIQWVTASIFQQQNRKQVRLMNFLFFVQYSD